MRKLTSWLVLPLVLVSSAQAERRAGSPGEFDFMNREAQRVMKLSCVPGTLEVTQYKIPGGMPDDTFSEGVKAIFNQTLRKVKQAGVNVSNIQRFPDGGAFYSPTLQTFNEVRGINARGQKFVMAYMCKTKK